MELPRFAGVHRDLPKLAQALLDEFGRAVKHARARRGWELNDLANRIAEMEAGRSGTKAKPPARTFLSDIEKGKRSISPPTVGKLIHALELPETWLARFLDTAPDEVDGETPKDREADRLIRLYEQDDTAPQTAETLLLLLAERWAQTKFTDPRAAYTALKGALLAADDLRQQGNLPSNASDAVQAVLRRVAELNDLGQLDDADAVLRDAMERNAAEAETLFEAALKQDRLRNDPAAAAKRLIARLRAAAPPGGLFNGTRSLLFETLERGEQQGDPFDLALALELAKANHERAAGALVATALNDLGHCDLSIGQRQSGGGHLVRARNAYAEALKMTPRRHDLDGWAICQSNLGNALQNLGDRTADPDLLRQAIAAHRAALTVVAPEESPSDWAGLQNNLGNALQALGDRTEDPDLLHQAIVAHRAALTVRSPEDAPMEWGRSQSNLGNALTALGEHTADPDLLRQAIAAHRAALTSFVPDATPIDWAGSQNNLGLALRWLGAVTGDATMMDEAEAAFADCLTLGNRDDAPFPWAKTQWNLADLALARHALSPDPAHLATARHHLALAREVFAEGGNDHQLAECDRLQALIDAR